jgi:putative oxidoreductase
MTRVLVSIWTVYWQFGFFMNWRGEPRGEGFEFHMLAFAMGAAILLRGSGAYSLDRILTGDRSSQSG